jgi:hypothetical protein
MGRAPIKAHDSVDNITPGDCQGDGDGIFQDVTWVGLRVFQFGSHGARTEQ